MQVTINRSGREWVISTPRHPYYGSIRPFVYHTYVKDQDEAIERFLEAYEEAKDGPSPQQPRTIEINPEDYE